MGKNADTNTTSLSEIINHALAWERYSGATFKGEKTTLVYFTRNAKLQSDIPLSIKGIDVKPQSEAKILGIIMDLGLRYKNHIKKVLSKGLKAALALKRMREVSSDTACQPFTATVAPIIN